MLPHPDYRSLVAVIAIGHGVLPFAGCASGPEQASSRIMVPTTQSTNGTSTGKLVSISPAQLQGSLMAYADRFLARIEEATDAIEQGTTDPKVRMLAHNAKYYSSLAVVTTAADPDPEVALLDLLAMITLERAVWKDGWAEAEFGPLAADLLKAHEELETEAWAIGAKLMTTEQLSALRALIDGWRAEHPDQKYVATVRFDDFMLLRDQNLRRRSSIIKVNLVLADTDAATAEIRKSRMFAERALFLAGRMPMLMSWQAELLAYDLALSPEVQQSLANATSVSDSIRQLSDDVKALPERIDSQIRTTMDQIDQREQAINGVVTNVREGLTEADAVAANLDAVVSNLSNVATETTAAAQALNEVVQSADALVGRYDKPGDSNAATQPDARPFDVREYTQALTELTSAAKELNALVQQSDALLQSPQWGSRVQQIDEAAARRIDQVDQLSERWLNDLDSRAADLSDRLTVRGIALIGIACAAALATALIFRLITRGK